MNLHEIAAAFLKLPLLESGARHSKSDTALLQTIHDHALSLGAACAVSESAGAHGSAGTGKTGNGSMHGAQELGIPSAARSSDALQSSDGLQESGIRETALQLVESAQTLDTIVLREARADYEIKLIAPGKGSSAFYPAEVLKRDGPGVFKASTHVFLNHATPSEERDHPCGDVKNLAGVLTTDAVYHEAHAKGPGLYARMKVFADHGQLVEEKAPFVGMSIRAAGDAVMEGKRPVMKDGVPILARLVSAESVDVVTRAGAGGMILTEAATSQSQVKESDMDEAAVQKLIEAAVKGAQAPLIERAIRGDARELATKTLREVTLTEVSKARVIETVLEKTIPQKDGALDVVAFTEAINAEAKREGAYVAALTGSGRVVGMGSGGVDPVKLKESEDAQAASMTKIREAGESIFGRLMGDNKEAAKAAASKGMAA